MPYTPIHLNKEVPVGVLEKILLDAAADVGWNAKVEDSYRTEYRLGSLHREQKYRWSEVKLRGSFLPLAEVVFDKEKPTQGSIEVNYGFGIGFATTREMVKYLIAVSKRIDSATRQEVVAGLTALLKKYHP